MARGEVIEHPFFNRKHQGRTIFSWRLETFTLAQVQKGEWLVEQTYPKWADFHLLKASACYTYCLDFLTINNIAVEAVMSTVKLIIARAHAQIMSPEV